MSELDELFFQYEQVLDYSINSIDKNIYIKIFLLEECPDLQEKIKKEIFEKYNVSINLTTEKKEDVFLASNTMIKRTVGQRICT